MKPNVPQLILATLASASGLSAQTSPEDIQEAVDASFGPWDVRIRDKVGYITTAWTKQNLVTLDGTDSAQLRPPVSPYISSAQLTATVTGPGKLYFSHLSGFRLSWGPGTTVKVGSAPAVPLPPGFSWQEASIDLGPGSQQVTWAFPTDGPTPSPSSFLDQIWTEDDPRPRVTSASFVDAASNQHISYQITPNKPCHTFAATGLPPGVTLDPATASVSGTPTELGSFDARITATNAGGSHTRSVIFRVLTPSGPAAMPLAAALDAIGPRWSQQPGPFFEPWSRGIGVPAGLGLTGTWSGSLTAKSKDGADAATAPLRMSPDAINATNWLGVEVEGPGTFSFWHRIIGFPNGAGQMPGAVTLLTRVDGSVNFYVLGVHLLISSEWEQRTIAVPSGHHLLEFLANTQNNGPPFADALVCFDQASFTTQPQSFTFEEWRKAVSPFSGDPTLDWEGDGFPLLLEYALGGSPVYHDGPLLPEVALIDGHLTMTVRKAQGTSGLEYTVQANKSLAGNGWTTFGTEIMNEDADVLVVRCKKTVAEEPTCMLRLRVRLDDSVGP